VMGETRYATHTQEVTVLRSGSFLGVTSTLMEAAS
jgi:hypothetical protein